MSELCDRFERRLDQAVGAGSERAGAWVGDRAPELPSELADHLAACPGCRGRLEAHRSLAAALGGRPVPALPAGFEARLRRRIAAEEGVKGSAGGERGGRGLRLLLPAYWTAAGLAAAAVLRWTGPAEALGAVGGPGVVALAATAAVTAAGLLLPAAALLRSRARLGAGDPLPRRLLAGRSR